jgi:hypothetical protein
MVTWPVTRALPLNDRSSLRLRLAGRTRRPGRRDPAQQPTPSLLPLPLLDYARHGPDDPLWRNAVIPGGAITVPALLIGG